MTPPKSYVGKEYDILIENETFDNKYYIGRSYMDIPETDGMVIIKSTKKNLRTAQSPLPITF